MRRHPGGRCMLIPLANLRLPLPPPVSSISSPTDDHTLLSFRKGELLVMIKDNEFSQKRGWIKGRNERTGKTGAVPIDAIFILPTLTKPSKELLVQRFLLFITIVVFNHSGEMVAVVTSGVCRFRICSACLRTRGKTWCRRRWAPSTDDLSPR